MDFVGITLGRKPKTWPEPSGRLPRDIDRAKLVRGQSVYGHYHGKIHPNLILGGRPFTHHGWIIRRTTLVDPTRWVFECVDPYIYVGPKNDLDYDPGGNRVRRMFLRPPPSFDAQQKAFELPPEVVAFAQLMLGEHRPVACVQQVMWLANLPLDMLGNQAEPLYRWIIEGVKIPGFIPIDNRLAVMGHQPAS